MGGEAGCGPGSPQSGASWESTGSLLEQDSDRGRNIILFESHNTVFMMYAVRLLLPYETVHKIL